MFAGIDNKARKAAGAYIGVDGVARRAKKLYIGVDGKARLCWEAGGGSGGGESDRVRAYLYNGVKLPELLPAPEGYHHVCIVRGAWPGLYTLTFLPSLAFSNISDKWSVDLSCGYVNTTCQANNPSLNHWGGLKEGTYTNIPVSNIMWANFDVLNEDGSTLLEASDPVPLCSYNGVELPERPQYDAATHPYAYICLHNPDEDDYYYTFKAFSTEVYKGSPTNATVLSYVKNGVSYGSFLCNERHEYPDKPVWYGETWNTVGQVALMSQDVIVWANFDMLYNDGTLCRGASEPQPVYM